MTLELIINSQNIWRRVVGWIFINISPSNILLKFLLLEKYHQNSKVGIKKLIKQIPHSTEFQFNDIPSPQPFITWWSWEYPGKCVENTAIFLGISGTFSRDFQYPYSFHYQYVTHHYDNQPTTSITASHSLVPGRWILVLKLLTSWPMVRFFQFLVILMTSVTTLGAIYHQPQELTPRH